MVDADALPRSAVLASVAAEVQLECLLSGGDDYELLFTAPATQRDAVQHAAQASGTPVTRIGAIELGSGIRVLQNGQPLTAHWASFDHFRA